MNNKTTNDLDLIQCSTVSTYEILKKIDNIMVSFTNVRNNLINTEPYDFDPQRRFSVKQKNIMLTLQHYRCNTVDQTNCSIIVTMSNSDADHIIPHSRKGLTVIRNGQMLCLPCHTQKTKNDLLAGY